MFNKPKGFRSSFRGGVSQKKYSRPFRNGHSSTSNNSSNGKRPRLNNRARPKSNLDVNLFIKKAQSISDIPDYTPNSSFAGFEITEQLKQNIQNQGFTKPTPIQDQAIEPILQGRDLIGLANTGTGKTAAFIIPLIDKIVKDRNQKALIIAPTRELAMQIYEDIRNFSAGLRIYSALVIGGANIRRQIHNVRSNPQFIIATPGRLKDLIMQHVLSLDEFRTIVLDEVDLMVDIGFINEIKYFIALMPIQRQSLFFSATIPAKVQEILQSFVNNPVTVSIKKQESSENIDQDVIRVVDKNKKVDQLHDLLIKDGFDKVLIFGRTKYGIEKLYKELIFRGFKTGAIHGNKRQSHRQRILQSFKQNEIQVLLATDLASRGLDIDNVTHVINYDLPETYDDYIHRIGRTGRAGKVGKALTFVE